MSRKRKNRAHTRTPTSLGRRQKRNKKAASSRRTEKHHSSRRRAALGEAAPHHTALHGTARHAPHRTAQHRTGPKTQAGGNRKSLLPPFAIATLGCRPCIVNTDNHRQLPPQQGYGGRFATATKERLGCTETVVFSGGDCSEEE